MIPTQSTIIIPNYNGLRYLPRLMESLAAQRDGRFEIIVVDDVSRDESVPYLQANWPRVRVIRNECNLGFAGSCNKGMQSATTPFVTLLNNDTHVDSDWFAEGIAPFDDPAIGAVASLVLLAEPPHLIDTAGDIYSVAGGAAKRNHLMPRESIAGLSREVHSACGASAFFRREAVTVAGYLDERFVSYYEDVDLGFRLAWAGYRTVFAPKSICYHHLSSSYSPTGWTYRFNSARNAEIVWWSNLSWRMIIRYLPAHTVFLILQCLAETRRGRFASWFGGKWSVLRRLDQVRSKRRQIRAIARVTDREVEFRLARNWWALHVGSKIDKLREWLRRR